MANTFRIVRDAANKQFVMETVDANGAVVSGAPRLVMAMGDVDEPTSVFRLGRIHFTDSDGNAKVAPALIAQPTDDTSDPDEDTPQDLRIGGGGGGGIWMGEWNNGKSFSSGQMVNVSSGAKAGVWVVNLGCTAQIGLDLTEGAIWHQLVGGWQTFALCDGGTTRHMSVNGNPPQ